MFLILKSSHAGAHIRRIAILPQACNGPLTKFIRFKRQLEMATQFSSLA